MTRHPDCDEEQVGELSTRQLAAYLLAGAEGARWTEQPAVQLVVSQGTWLDRWEFRQAVDLWIEPDGLRAFVDWQNSEEAPASGGELRILAIARSLAGVASDRPLDDLLTGLDETNTDRVLEAIGVACRGPGAVCSSEGRNGGLS